jgi:hypothetical protein
MITRRVRFLPEIEVLTGRIVPSADLTGAALAPAADAGLSDQGSTDVMTVDYGPSDSGGDGDGDGDFDPMGPGGPVTDDVTEANPNPGPADPFD